MTVRRIRNTLTALLKNKMVVVLLLLNLVAILVLIGVLIRQGREENTPLYYETYVLAACEEFQMPKELVLAVIRTESDFRPRAESSVGARGLMQMTESALSDVNLQLKTSYSFEDMFDPEINIRCGTCYLSRMYRQFGDYEIALAAYNAGPGVVSNWLSDDRYAENGRLILIPYPETEAYVRRVMAFREEYMELYQEKLK